MSIWSVSPCPYLCLLSVSFSLALLSVPLSLSPLCLHQFVQEDRLVSLECVSRAGKPAAEVCGLNTLLYCTSFSLLYLTSLYSTLLYCSSELDRECIPYINTRLTLFTVL